MPRHLVTHSSLHPVTAMDYDLPPEYNALRRMIREFCEEEIKPLAHHIDESGVVESDLLRRMGALGFLGVPFPREYGGMGAGELGYCIMMEELSAPRPRSPPSSARTSASA